ncbi:hypothetical protein CYMTET_18947 [Cymbomonas tetramitiformis]|uniref:Uncharacterized protein n=1 Tax=Cymbomonas tetramitiformis TaxID=36881 RepID=A0AAE0G747_9CHLO|nr:hypothetical protein CYMTET_18947 [Cymbomonas tetramitiformis]
MGTLAISRETDCKARHVAFARLVSVSKEANTFNHGVVLINLICLALFFGLHRYRYLRSYTGGWHRLSWQVVLFAFQPFPFQLELPVLAPGSLECVMIACAIYTVVQCSYDAPMGYPPPPSHLGLYRALKFVILVWPCAIALLHSPQEHPSAIIIGVQRSAALCSAVHYSRAPHCSVACVHCTVVGCSEVNVAMECCISVPWTTEVLALPMRWRMPVTSVLFTVIVDFCIAFINRQVSKQHLEEANSLLTGPS